MFKKAKGETQLGIFSQASVFLSGKAANIYEDTKGWHNIFRSEVLMRIDESICKPLFTDNTGAPNSPVRLLIAMMIIKEASRLSDEQLFEQARFNLLIRSALGLINTDDKVPTQSTYYLFRNKIVEYEKGTGVNLFEKVFTDVTKGQAQDFQVSGKSVRMDSKLMGSNITWLSRYELIHETLRMFCSKAKGSLPYQNLLVEDKELIENILKEKGNKVVYRSTGDEVKNKIQELGLLAHKLIQLFNASYPHYETLERLFSEQFILDETKIVVARNKEDISAHSIQSPHDTDCHYRNKDDNKVKGYSINLTESCDAETLNLISDIDVRVASASDNEFMQDAVNQTQEIFAAPIQNLHTDGAYHSPGNQEFCETENIAFHLNAIQGPKGRYDLSLNDDNELTVLDTVTNEIMPATKLKDQQKWRIKTKKGIRYFTAKEITASMLRKKIAATPQEILNIRNNVEATIFQLGYHYPNDKSRYRGLIKHKMWAHMRCLWVNFVRIVNYVTKPCKKTPLCPIFDRLTNIAIQIWHTKANMKLLLQIPKQFHYKNQIKWSF